MAEFISGAPLSSVFLGLAKQAGETYGNCVKYAAIIREVARLGQHKRVLLCGQNLKDTAMRLKNSQKLRRFFAS